MNDTMLTLVGNVVNDVSLRYTTNGHPVAQFRVANGTRRFDRASNAWVDSDTHYFNVTMWRDFALNASSSIRKGMPVVVYGKLRSREIQRPCGETSHTVLYHDVEAFAVGPNVARGTVTFERQIRASVTENDMRAMADTMIERDEFADEYSEDDIVEEVDLETGEITPISMAS